MSKTIKPAAGRTSFREFLAEQMKDPDFRREYQALEPEFAIIKQIIELRIKRQLSQAQLAQRIGTQQPSIARLEARGRVKNLDYLQRIANALDARVEVRLVPREASGARSRRVVKRV